MLDNLRGLANVGLSLFRERPGQANFGLVRFDPQPTVEPSKPPSEHTEAVGVSQLVTQADWLSIHTCRARVWIKLYKIVNILLINIIANIALDCQIEH